MKKPTPKRLTKRQRKYLRGPNAAMLRSVQSKGAVTYEMSDRTYSGLPPVYHIRDGKIVKVQAGLPFVRVK